MTKPHVTRHQLQPFGGIRAAAALTNLREEALRTLSRQECFDKGFLTVKDLDDEELRYGRCRDESGNIPKVNKKTETIPRHIYDAMVAEHELRYKQKLRQNLDAAIDTMVDIMNDDTAEPKDRFQAAQYIFERTAGKTPDNVNVNVKAAPWEDLLGQITGIAPLSRAEHRELQSGIVEAEWDEIDDQKGDRPDEADILDPNQAEPQGPIRQAQAEQHADVEPAKVDDVGAHTTPTPERQADSTPTAESPEFHTQKDGPTAQAVDRDIEDVGPGPKWAVDNEKPVYHNEGDIHTYGHRKAQAKSYAEQARDAAELAIRRKEAKTKRNDAKKNRKIARAMGADAIKDEITGVNVGDDGQVQFE